MGFHPTDTDRLQRTVKISFTETALKERDRAAARAALEKAVRLCELEASDPDISGPDQNPFVVWDTACLACKAAIRALIDNLDKEPQP